MLVGLLLVCNVLIVGTPQCSWPDGTPTTVYQFDKLFPSEDAKGKSLVSECLRQTLNQKRKISIAPGELIVAQCTDSATPGLAALKVVH